MKAKIICITFAFSTTTTGMGKKVFFISNWLNEIRHTGKPGLRLFYLIFMISVTIIKEVILLAFLTIYFILGAAAVILYMIFYENIYQKLTLKFKKKENNPSPCDLGWDYSNLNLDCEEL